MKKLLFTLSLLLSLTLSAQTYSPSGMMRFKRVLTANEVNNSFTTPVSLIAAPGAGKIIYIDPYSVAIDMSTGTAFDFTASSIYIAIGSSYVMGLSYTSFNSNDWLNPGFTYSNSIISMTSSSSNNEVLFLNDADDGSAGTRTVTITFNYCILNLN